MFATALQKVQDFTWPVIVNTRRFDGRIESAVGTFVIVNKDGWFVTASHIVSFSTTFTSDQPQIADHESKVAKINIMSASAGKKATLLKGLKPNPDWLTNLSYWWGRDGVSVATVEINALADLAIGRLDPFDPTWVPSYPIFKKVTAELDPGTSLCRLGFPFNAVKSTFDPATGFSLPPGTLPMPRFPNEGILTRIAINADLAGNTAKFVETSSPGLRGQSGGPVFDQDGLIYGIQSQTIHLELGFSPRVTDPVTKKPTVEHQFINLGLAGHVDEVRKLLDTHGVAYQLSA